MRCRRYPRGLRCGRGGWRYVADAHAEGPEGDEIVFVQRGGGATDRLVVDDRAVGAAQVHHGALPIVVDADLRAEAPTEAHARLGDFELPTWEQEAVREAPVRSGSRPFPLILFSHGNAAIRWQSFSLATHLASHGYVVAAPDHPGNTLFDQIDLDSTRAQLGAHVIDRPHDVSLVLQLIEAGELSPVDASADCEQVGLCGHSFGGFTSLMLAHPSAPFLKPCFKSVVAIATPAAGLSAMGLGLGGLQIPVLLVAGIDDETVPLGPEIQVPYDSASAPKALLKVAGAGHVSFSNLLDDRLLQAAARLNFPDDLQHGLRDGIGPGFAEPDWVHQSSQEMIAAWFDLSVRGDEEAAERLSAGGLAEGFELLLER